MPCTPTSPATRTGTGFTCDALLAADGGTDVPLHVDGASGVLVAPFIDPDLVWDFRIPRVESINVSGHMYGLVYPGAALTRI